MSKKPVMIKLLTCFLVVLFFFPYSFIFADDLEEDNSINEINENEILETSSKDTNNLNLNSRACIVLDRASKKVLYGKNEYQKVKMASTTKIMTATVVLENCTNLNQTIEVSKKAAGTGGSRSGLKAGDKITIHDLLYGLLLCSGNDAAVALAEAISGNVTSFCELMNQKAEELGLNHSHFESPHGLDSDGHYTTAYELALLSDYALKNATFLEIVGTRNYTITINGYPKTLTNTNELLGNLTGVYGIKTGFTNGANRCLVTACKRDNMDIICVVLGCDTKKFRTTDSIKLINYAFENFEPVDIKELIEKEFDNWKQENQNNFTILKGENSSLDISYSSIDQPIVPIDKSEISSLEVEITANQELVAPINEDEILGKIKIKTSNQTISEYNLIAKNSIKKKDIFDYLQLFFKDYGDQLNYLTSNFL